MGRGGYNGGSTLIGPGRSWSFDPDFAFRDSRRTPNSGTRQPSKPASPQPAITVAGAAVGRKILRKHRQAQSQNVDRDFVLIGMGMKLPKKLAERRVALKRLVTDKVLLPTGVINIGHPAVAAWLKTNRKTIKKHG